jgi:hypothetical protein
MFVLMPFAAKSNDIYKMGTKVGLVFDFNSRLRGGDGSVEKFFGA